MSGRSDVPGIIPGCRRVQAALWGGSLLLGALACGGGPTGPSATAPPTPPLEPVPYAALGSARVLFQRIGGPDGEYDAAYLIDAQGQRSTPALDTVRSPIVFGPSLSPTGGDVAWNRYTSDSGYVAVVTDLSGAHLRRISPLSSLANNVDPPSWTPSGAAVVFGFHPAARESLGIYQRTLASGALVALRTYASDPEGVAACNDRFPPVSVTSQGGVAYACGGGVWVAPSPADPLERVYAPADSNARVEGAAWSPNGDEVAFLEVLYGAEPTGGAGSADYPVVNTSVGVLDPGTGDVRILAQLEGSGSVFYAAFNLLSLCWLPDGHNVVFNAPTTGVAGNDPILAHLWVVGANGGDLVQLTTAQDAFDYSVSCA